MRTASALHLSLSDVARLAGVQRPVATMWRKRPHEARPFPEPVATIGGQERFDAFEIADYLATTGRGNTRVEREDVAAHATLAGVAGLPESSVFTALTALLTLSVLTGEPLSGLTSAGVLALAADADPGDTYVRRELEAVAVDLATLAAHADALADASYSVPAAFELLLRQQRRSLPGRAAVALRDEAVELVARVAGALAAEADWATPVFADVTDGSGDLLLKTIQGYAAEPGPSAATVPLDTPSARLVRRRLRAHDIHRIDAGVDDAGSALPAAESDGTVHVLQLPTVAAPAMPDVEVLDVIGDLLVQLAPDSRVVVIGPATALADQPANAEADRARDAVLRSGRLRAVVRLPAGLMVQSPRRHLALWALGPTYADVPIAERWTFVGDLSDTALDASVLEDVVTDVVASMTSPRVARTHAYRFARPVPTTRLIPGRKALVGSPIRRRDGAVGIVTLGDATDRRMCRVLPGNRVRPDDLLTHGRRAVGPSELLGESPIGGRAVDPVTFPSAYPSSRYTEPGDVVFCTAPRVAAWVDREGGSVVLSPARSVRVVGGGDSGIPPLSPDVIAADIARAAGAATGEAKDWRRWPIRLVPRERLAALKAELDRVAAERAALTARLADLDVQAARAIDEATRPQPEGH